jgi:cytochrome P450
MHSGPEEALPSGLELSELDKTFRDAPHGALDLLRARAPRYLDPHSGGRRLLLTRHGDVKKALSDRDLTRDARAAPARGADTAAGTLLSIEGNKHRLGRRLVGRALDARAVAARREDAVALVEALLDGIEGRKRFDGIDDFAAPVPLTMIADILGLPRTDIGDIRVWSEDAGVLTMLPQRTAEQEAKLARTNAALGAYVMTAVKARRAAPGDDLISDLIAAEFEGNRLSDGDIAPLCLLMLIAGNLTTTDVIGNGIVLLLRHPDQLALLRARPELIDATVEEILRFDPPVSAAARHLPAAGEYLGHCLPMGGTVKASLLAANHDPDVFDDPHVFRIDRPRREHLAFGGGAHACPGAALARMQAATALSRLFARFPGLRLAGDTPRKVTYGFRGYASLPLATS